MDHSAPQATETTFSFAPAVPAPPDARLAERHTSLLRVGMLRTLHGKDLCLIRNVSALGLRAQVYTDLVVGDRVSVELKTAEEVSGRVIWARGHDVGVAFDEEIDIGELLASHTLDGRGHQPRMPRVELRCSVRLRAGARSVWCRAVDVSQGGVKVETERAFAVDQELVVTMDGYHPVPGRVRWADGRFVGVAFHQPLPFHEMVLWLKQVQHREG